MTGVGFMGARVPPANGHLLSLSAGRIFSGFGLFRRLLYQHNMLIPISESSRRRREIPSHLGKPRLRLTRQPGIPGLLDNADWLRWGSGGNSVIGRASSSADD